MRPSTTPATFFRCCCWASQSLQVFKAASTLCLRQKSRTCSSSAFLTACTISPSLHAFHAYPCDRGTSMQSGLYARPDKSQQHQRAAISSWSWMLPSGPASFSPCIGQACVSRLCKMPEVDRAQVLVFALELISEAACWIID